CLAASSRIASSEGGPPGSVDAPPADGAPPAEDAPPAKDAPPSDDASAFEAPPDERLGVPEPSDPHAVGPMSTRATANKCERNRRRLSRMRLQSRRQSQQAPHQANAP